MTETTSDEILKEMKLFQRKTIALLAVFIILLAVIPLVVYRMIKNKQYPQQQSTNPTSSSPFITSSPQINTVSYTIHFPPDWHSVQNINPQDTVKRYTFSVNGETYSFQTFPRGSMSLQGATTKADTLEEQAKILQGRQFLLRIWSANNTPFLIMAIPNEENLDIGGFMMDIPPQNSSTYITQFENLLATMQINSPAPLTPAQPLITPQTYHMQPQQ